MQMQKVTAEGEETKNQMGISEPKNTQTATKNVMEKLKFIMELKKERVGELEDRSLEITEFMTNKRRKSRNTAINV